MKVLLYLSKIDIIFQSIIIYLSKITGKPVPNKYKDHGGGNAIIMNKRKQRFSYLRL